MYDAVGDTRGTLLNEARSASRDAREAQYSPQPVPVIEIIRSLIHTYFEFRAKDPVGWDYWIQLLQKENGTELYDRAINRNLSIVIRRYLNCLHRSVPGADRSDLFFALTLANCAMVLGSERILKDGLSYGVAGSRTE